MNDTTRPTTKAAALRFLSNRFSSEEAFVANLINERSTKPARKLVTLAGLVLDGWRIRTAPFESDVLAAERFTAGSGWQSTSGGFAELLDDPATLRDLTFHE